MAEKPYILAICNRKGGSGKTTTAVNLAAEFSRVGMKVLLIDLDPQNHVRLGLGIAVKDVPGAHALFSESQAESADQALLKSRIRSRGGIDLIPATEDFDASHVGADPRRLHKALGHSDFEQYDLIVLDTPPSIDAVLMNALVAANGVLLPLMPHHLAVQGVRDLSRLFVRASVLGGGPTRLIGFLPIMVDRRVRLQKAVLETLADEFGQERCLRGIRSDIRLAEAFAEGQTIQEFAPSSRGAMDYRLTAELLLHEPGLRDRQEKVQAEVTEPQSDIPSHSGNDQALLMTE